MGSESEILTLYVEVYPRAKLGNRKVQHQFLDQLASMPGLRDCKTVHYGLYLSQNRRMNRARRSVRCMIAACTIFVLWCKGPAVKQTDIAQQVRINLLGKRPSYSAVFLAKLLMTQAHFRLPGRALNDALNEIKTYMGIVLCD
jgi:hypothetical protein